MTDSLRERVYADVLHMVIWDEPEDGIFKMLEVNGITGDDARNMFAKAYAIRVASIRTDCRHMVVTGAVWSILGGGTFYWFWFGLGGISRGVFIMTVGAFAIGLYKMLNGISGAIFAAKKRGSLAD